MVDKPDALARPKRFYKAATAAAEGAGFAVQLDGRTPRTPAGGKLILPTQPLAELIAAEWEAQVSEIVSESMPATRLANTVIDRIGQVRDETAREVARYAGSDLLCYFAERPRALVEEEEARWGPLLDWAENDLGVALRRVSGVVHQAQDTVALARIEGLANALDDFALAALIHAAGLLGSVVLALALQRGRIDGAEAFALSHLDEAFQARHWGQDAEAAARAETIEAEAVMLGRWFRALD